MPGAAEGELDAMMDQALAMGASAGANQVEQRHRSLLEQAGTDPAKHVVRGLPLQDDVVYAISMK